MSEYKAAFFIVPSRILDLPELQLSYLRVYETIFQFWNHGKSCYLKNDVIMERTGIKSPSTIKDAFLYFEKHNELKRIYKGSRRYLIQPEREIEIENDPVDNSDDNSTKNSQVAELAAPGSRVSGPQVAELAAHNIKKINKEIKRESSTDFLPDKENIEFAKRLKVDIEIELESFKNRFKGEKNQYEFGRWLVHAKEYTEKSENGKFKNKSKETGSTVKFFEPGNPDYDRLHGIG